jgi:hypothetical protein
MKTLIKKNFPHIALGILIAVYESASYFLNFDFVPKWLKVVIGVIAFAGLVAKNYKK